MTNNPMTNNPIPTQWRGIGPDMYGYIIEVICHPQRPGHLYGRSDVGGLLFSADAGESWSPLNNGLAPDLEPGNVRHRDGAKWGYYWHIYDGRLAVSGLAIDPFDPDHFLLTTGSVYSLHPDAGRNRGGVAFGEVFSSRDAGSSWQRLNDDLIVDGTGGNRVHGPMSFFHPGIRDRVFLATTHDGVFVSDDAGSNWRYLGLRGTSLSSLQPHPANPDLLVLAGWTDTTYWGAPTSGGVWILDANSGSVREGEGLLGKSVRAMSLTPSAWYAAAEADGLWRSDDQGATWRSIHGSLPAHDNHYYFSWNTISSPAGFPETIYASALNKLAISENGGASWRLFLPTPETVDAEGTNIGPEELMSASSSIVFDPHQPGRVYLTDFHGVWRSDDLGAHWRACHRGLANTCIKRVYPLVTESGESRIAVAQTDGGLQMSDLGVTRLRRVMGFKNAGVHCPENVEPEGLIEFSAACSSFAQHPRNPDIIYATQNQAQHGGYGTAVVVWTQDGGRTWQPRNSGLPRRQAWFKEIVIDPFNPDILYLANGFSEEEGGGLYISFDAGASWQARPSPFASRVDFYSQVDANLERALICDPHVEGRLLTAGRIHGVFESLDRGESWRDITANLPLGKSVGIGTILLHHTTGKLWVGGYDIGLWALPEDGIWQQIPTGPHRSAKCLCQDAAGTLYAAFIANWFSPSHTGLFSSNDNGVTWQPLDLSGLPNRMFSSIECDPLQTGRLYVGTIGSGVFVADSQPAARRGHSSISEY